jgi:hypothetical protein
MPDFVACVFLLAHSGTAPTAPFFRPPAQVREKEEDAKILEYTRARDAREAEVAAEKARLAREKEMETARLRALQVG